MGEFKPLLRLGSRSVLGHCLRLFTDAGVKGTVVVTGHHHREVEAEVRRLGGEFRHNPDFAQGMYSSVRIGVEAMGEMDGFFLLPVDIPLVRPATLEQLITAFDGSGAVYPCRHGLRGHPPLIAASLIGPIRAYEGEGGLRSLLERYPGKDVEVWDDGVLMDADTPEDFSRLRERVNRLTIGSRAEAETLAVQLMPERGVMHGRAVAEIACRLATELNRCGYRLDLDLVHNAALLHDAAKGQPDHEARGAELMHCLGLAGLAEAVGSHREPSAELPATLGEKELVCLADKLAKCNRRMSVRERFEEKLALYAGDEEACRVIRYRLDRTLALQRAVEAVASRTLEEILEGDRTA
jgi:CTP:molybdopterin cytidylyltransferase MocA